MRPAYFIRVDRQETLATVAEATGLHADTISAFETGETRRAAPRTLAALSRHYGVSVRELLDDVPRAA